MPLRYLSQGSRCFGTKSQRMERMLEVSGISIIFLHVSSGLMRQMQVLLIVILLKSRSRLTILGNLDLFLRKRGEDWLYIKVLSCL